jgi:molecular chaperone IbpA
MRAFDLSPLFSTTVGFDRMARMLEQMPSETAPTYPPYNIQKMDENAYRVTLAVAGFGDDEIAIEVKENLLTVSGKLARENGAGESYLHRGIASRAFERRFNLADHIQVTGAALDKGLLHIDLVRELPETLKARRIAIETDGRERLGQKAA